MRRGLGFFLRGGGPRSGGFCVPKTIVGRSLCTSSAGVTKFPMQHNNAPAFHFRDLPPLQAALLEFELLEADGQRGQRATQLVAWVVSPDGVLAAHNTVSGPVRPLPCGLARAVEGRCGREGTGSGRGAGGEREGSQGAGLTSRLSSAQSEGKSCEISTMSALFAKAP